MQLLLVVGTASEAEVLPAAASLQAHAAAVCGCDGDGCWLGAVGCILCAATVANTIWRVSVKLCSRTALHVTQ